MQASALTFDVDADFDRIAAETYLQALRGDPAPRPRPAKVVRQETPTVREPQPVAAPSEQPSLRKTNARAWAAAAAAVIVVGAPVSLGAGWAYWSGSKPASPAPESRPERVQIERPAADAYMVATPVVMQHPLKPPKPGRATRPHSRRAHPRPAAAATRRPAVEDVNEEIPADFPF